MTENTTSEKFISPCPPPTPYQSELLQILIEECAEVQQRATKMLRFGVDEIQPGQPDSNLKRLSDEVGDLKAMIEHCCDAGVIDPFATEDARKQKKHKLAKYMQTTPEDVK